MVELAFGLVYLLAQKVERGGNLLPRFVGIKFYVVANAVSGEKAIDGARSQQFLGDNLAEQFLRVLEQLFCLRIFEDCRITATQLPGVEKRRPIDKWNKLLQRKIVQYPHSSK